MQIPSLPFKILVLAPLGPQEDRPWDSRPLRVDQTNFDQVMESLELSHFVSLPKDLCPMGGLTLSLKRLKDFHPEGLISGNPFLKNMIEARTSVEEAKRGGLSEEEIKGRLKAWPDLPIELKLEGRKQKPSSSNTLDNILTMISVPEQKSIPNGGIQTFITQMDSILREILRRIFSDEHFRNLESTWQGLRFLSKQGDFDGGMILEVVPASMDTLEETLDRLTPGLIQDLPSLILIDLPCENTPRSLDLLDRIALLSETLMVPALCWVTPKFFYLDRWQDLNRLPYLPNHIEDPSFAKWRNLRKARAGGWLAAICNRFLVRYPYGPENNPGLIHFEEAHPLWISPVWAVGSLIVQSHLKTGWPTRFTEWLNIRLGDLALREAEEKKYLPTEVLFPEDRITQLIKVGILPLVSSDRKDFAFTPFETTVAGVSLSHQLFLSRITQFLFWCKDHFEGDLGPAEIEKRLNQAFSLFWERHGQLGPKRIQISAAQPDPEKPATVKILIQPSGQMLPSGERVELELNW